MPVSPSRRSAKLILLLAGACATSPDAASDYGKRDIGPAVLVGYLRAGPELTLYSRSESANAHSYEACINGVTEGIDPAQTLLFDKRLVEISGRIELYTEDKDDINAMLGPIKNHCRLHNIFIAKSIRSIAN